MHTAVHGTELAICVATFVPVTVATIVAAIAYVRIALRS